MLGRGWWGGDGMGSHTLGLGTTGAKLWHQFSPLLFLNFYCLTITHSYSPQVLLPHEQQPSHPQYPPDLLDQYHHQTFSEVFRKHDG